MARRENTKLEYTVQQDSAIYTIITYSSAENTSGGDTELHDQEPNIFPF
jgi:hypothetical protein